LSNFKIYNFNALDLSSRIHLIASDAKYASLSISFICKESATAKYSSKLAVVPAFGVVFFEFPKRRIRPELAEMGTRASNTRMFLTVQRLITSNAVMIVITIENPFSPMDLLETQNQMLNTTKTKMNAGIVNIR
jgi:hypothetical protein